MKIFMTRSILVLTMLFTTVSFMASTVKASDKGWHEKDRHGYGCSKSHDGGYDYLTSAKWRNTLSDEQRAEIDKLNLSLKKEISSIEAKIDLKRTEVKNLVTSDNPDTPTLERLADEISMLEKEVIQLRYEYMIKVRSLLKPEQKAMFDMTVFTKKDGHKSHW